LAGRLAATLKKSLKGRLRTKRLFSLLVTVMPIKIPDGLPAFDALVHEGVRVMTETAAIRQDIRPLQIGLLNLMPNKIKTELQMARLLGASPLQVELSLIRIGNHKAKNTSEDHLLAFYQTWEEVKERKFDGFIVTGTPVETIPYEEVTFWPEMQRIFDWTRTHVHSTLNVCWGAMAALYHFHGVPKHQLSQKAFGVYRQKILKPSSPYLNGFSDDFAIPISRWAEIRAARMSRASAWSRRANPGGSMSSTISNMIRPRWPTNISAMSAPASRSRCRSTISRRTTRHCRRSIAGGRMAI
jgi:homoserine O-succinyltransferase